MSINKVFLSGNLTSDPEMKATTNSTIMSFRIAVNERSKDAQGNWVDKPNYFPCFMFGKRAEAVNKYLSKGVKVSIEGHLRWHEWQDKQGNKRQDIEVIVDEIEWSAKQQAPATQSPKRQAPAKAPMFVPADAYASEDIPF